MIGKIFNPIFILHNSVIVEYKNQNIRLNADEYEFVIDDNIEIWKDVFEYEGFYQVSNLGRIRSLDRFIININGLKYLIKGQPIKTGIGKDNNARVNLSKDGVRKTHSLARIVYKAFNHDFDYYDNNLIIDHKNNKGEDNELNNLYVISRKNIELMEEYKKDKQSVICVTTNKEFKRITDASRYYNVNAGSISGCCQGRYPSAGKIILDDGTVYKLVWRYLKEEIWKDVIEYEGLYQVSNFGRVKRVYGHKGEKIIKPKLHRNGSVQIGLSKNGKKINYSIARIECKAFNPSFDDKNLDLEVRHKDNNSLNNELNNLYISSKNIKNGYNVKLFCITTKKEFNRLKDAKRYANLKSGNGINLCCKGKQEYAGKLKDGTKLKWKYK